MCQWKDGIKNNRQMFYGKAKLDLQLQTQESTVNINLQAQNFIDSNVSPYSRSH